MSFEDMAAAAQDPKNLPVEFEFDTTLVRTIAKEGQAWFVAKDVCHILGIADPSMALSRLDEDEKGTSNIGTLGGPQTMLTVNESGLYALIFTSRKPEAKRFRKWVTSEVLPAIRQRPGDTSAIPRTTPIRSSSGRSSSASDRPTSSPRASASAI
jgi:prophage antirepressor-like protein